MAAPTVTGKQQGRTTGERPTRYHLVVVGRDGAAPRALPAAGELLIGRDEDADLRIVDPQASRHHARVIVGESIQVEDLGSRNGTRLRDRPLEGGRPVPFQLGDALTIGATVLVLQCGDPELEQRRVWTHGYLEIRVVEECARAQRRASEFALARLHVQGQAPALLVEEALGGRLRDGDLLAMYAPSEYEVLLLDCAAATSRTLADGMVAALAGKGITATCGLALFPADGTSPQALVGRASERVRASGGSRAGQAAVAPANRPEAGVVVESPAMRALHALAERAATGNSNVLIVGETGAGKEVLAEKVHRASPRAGKPFLPLNCAAFSESLVESELFGHERGAFTGAGQAKAGLLEAAAGGTLFLDEIGEMPLAVQAKLLRVIETRQVLRIGATKPHTVDVRFIAATNRDLEEEVAEKRFREDLYFRLNVIALEIPPLRERPEEIASLARLFLDRLAQPLGRPAPQLSNETLTALEAYAWPGNVRELRNVIERAFVLCTGPLVTPEHLPIEKMSRNSRRAAAAPALAESQGALPIPESGPGRPGRSLKEIERDAIIDALERCQNNQTRAAELLGMPRRTFCKRMKEYQIPRPRS
jgi:DNA-binding NtrC family response regulator